MSICTNFLNVTHQKKVISKLKSSKALPFSEVLTKDDLSRHMQNMKYRERIFPPEVTDVGDRYSPPFLLMAELKKTRCVWCFSCASLPQARLSTRINILGDPSESDPSDQRKNFKISNPLYH